MSNMMRKVKGRRRVTSLGAAGLNKYLITVRYVYVCVWFSFLNFQNTCAAEVDAGQQRCYIF